MGLDVHRLFLEGDTSNRSNLPPHRKKTGVWKAGVGGKVFTVYPLASFDREPCERITCAKNKFSKLLGEKSGQQ